MNEYKSIRPSLSISLTDKCNFNCIYCPPFGENLTPCENLCSISEITELIKCSQKYELPVVRITGGEPLLLPDKVSDILLCCSNSYKGKVILNTNASLFDINRKMLNNYKNNFLLKISLDSIHEHTFNIMTRSSAFRQVYDSLNNAVNDGFSIELNSVITKANSNEILDLVSYAAKIGVNVKLFGVNSFEGMVDTSESSVDFSTIISSLELLYKRSTPEGLPGGRGIEMPKFDLGNGHFLWIVDHEKNSKINSSSKVYSITCDDCLYYPCATGKFSITLRADGLLQGCRMRPEKGYSIIGKSAEEIEHILLFILNEYETCYRYQ